MLQEVPLEHRIQTLADRINEIFDLDRDALLDAVVRGDAETLVPYVGSSTTTANTPRTTSRPTRRRLPRAASSTRGMSRREPGIFKLCTFFAATLAHT